MSQRRVWEYLAVLGLGVVLALEPAPPLAAAPPSQSRTRRVSTLYSKHRNFKIPFNVDESDKEKLREVQLWVSEDKGVGWETKSRITPEQPPSFSFRSSHDGEYWFAVRTIDLSGRALPERGEVEPSLKVIVDTVPPSLIIEQDGRRGSMASVHWEVRDENLNLNSLVLEYQQEGGRSWHQVPLNRVAMVGSTSFDAGTAESLKLRARIDDKAGNRAESVITLDEGSASRPARVASEAPDFAPSPSMNALNPGGNFPPVDAGSDDGGVPESAPPRRPQGTRNTRPRADDDEAFQGEPVESAPPARPNDRDNAQPGSPRTMLVANPKFSLQYAVDDAGQNGPASVEMWITQDGGRTWAQLGEDPDRRSPFEINLPGEGTYGLTMVARAQSGLGDQDPAPGDQPQAWVEVDASPPTVKLETPQVGLGQWVGKVSISWRAHDPHLAARPVTLFWRADQPNAPWQQIAANLENSGRYIWTVPSNLPPRVHIRVEAIDAAGNKGFAETTETGAVIVDRTRPRGRIIGLDGATPRTGQNNNFRGFR